MPSIQSPDVATVILLPEDGHDQQRQKTAASRAHHHPEQQLSTVQVGKLRVLILAVFFFQGNAWCSRSVGLDLDQ